jgi:hypothetical protein
MANITKLISAIRADGWQNILTGLGMAERDKRMSNAPIIQKFSQSELENLYRSDDIAQKVVNRVPNEMFRTGYKIKSEKENASQSIEKYLKNLNADPAFCKALKLARLHGGSGIVMGIDDGQDASMPVKLNAIKSIKWLAVLDRWRLVYDSIQSDLSKPGYGLPETYQIQAIHSETPQTNMIVHASRVIRFEGVEIPEQSFISNNYWGDSYFSTIYTPLLNYNSSHDGAASTMQDFIQTVYELENLADLIASGDDQLVQKRLALLDATRSIIKAIVIQKGENFRRENVNVSGMPELLTKVENRLVAACNMPHTIVLGEGSQGQTSGQSEKMDFYDMVSYEQVTNLMPKQMQLINLICLAGDGPKVLPEQVSIQYNPLWEPTETEEAQTYKTNAEADSIYIDRGVIDPIEVTKSRFGTPESEIQVDIKLREQISKPIDEQLNYQNGLPDSNIQSTALNGAQVTALLEVVSKVTSGEVSKESAKSIIRSAFPLLIDNDINGIINSLKMNIIANNNQTKTDSELIPFTIYISKIKFESMDKAAAWISANNYKNENPMETEKTFEFQQMDISNFIPYSLITVELGEGIKAICGKIMPQPQDFNDIINIENIIRASM